MTFGFRRTSSFALTLILIIVPAHHGRSQSVTKLLPDSTSVREGFSLLRPSDTGVSFTNILSVERHLTNQIFLNGSGVAAGDVDGDGWCDLYFCGLDGQGALYRNRGHWRFEDITETAGVACPHLDATGAALADLDGDGDLDLLVSSVGGGMRLFLNEGRGRFQAAPAASSFNAGLGGMSLALADIDGDGDLDVYVANYRTVTVRDQPNTRSTINTADGQPRVVSVNGRPLSDPDLAHRFTFHFGPGGTFNFNENGEPDLLLRNDGAGRFTPLSWTDGTFVDEQGRALAAPPFDWGLSVMFRDLNGDGAPDIYVCNDFKSPDRIWMNDGRGHFRALGPLAVRQTSLSSMGVDFADINRDGLDDFLVVDMLSQGHVHRLTQQMEIAPEQFPIGAIENRPQFPRNTLFLNRGDGTWAECAQFSGLEASEWSWTPVFLDVDLDGYEDLLVSNGFERDNMNADTLQRLEQLKKQQSLPPVEQLRLRKIFPRLDTPNLAFRNLGNLRFQDASAQWRFNDAGISQGMCLADLDNDGDLDVVVNNLNGPAGLYRNETPAPRLAVRLKGAPPNTHGIGAKIKVLGGPVPQSQEMICGGRYLSSDDAVRTFAAGSPTNVLAIEVTWRSGKRSSVRNARPNHLYEIDEKSVVSSQWSVASTTNGSASQQRTTDNGQRTQLFTDVSTLLNHTHHEEPFDDFSIQPTLPRRLSQLGPGVSWFDMDGDGWDDLIVGSGKGGTLAVFQNNGHGGFVRLEGAPFHQIVTRDQTTILGWRQDDRAQLLAGSANYEDGRVEGGVARRFNLAAKVIEEALPGAEASTGPLALADFDGDGRLDLFVGGRVRSERYPEPVSSTLFRGQGASFTPDRENTATLRNAGLVSGAVFSDLDGDGWPELILACEWGPLKIFRNNKGRLADWNPPITLTSQQSAPSQLETSTLRSTATEDGRNSKPKTLSQLTGWWNGVTTGDFDGDGRLDLAASNWGDNTRYERFRGRPLRVFYGALFADGVVQVIEGYTEAATRRLLPLQSFHLMGMAMPSLRERIGTFEAYATRSLPDLYGDSWKAAKELQAVTLESMVFLNRGDHFEAAALPLEAQLSPAFAVCASDFDGDGAVDLFLSQNFFALPPDVSRHDAGRGLLLKGDGKGLFNAIPGQQSGIAVYGEQRGAAAGDFDGDGRVDLVVTQNGAETRLYKNVGARPGLRVRLAGPPANPSGIGALLRLVTGRNRGPAREIHAGSGYWSQDSAVQVLSAPEPPTQLSIRWPVGKTITVDIPAGAREIAVKVNGELSVLR